VLSVKLCPANAILDDALLFGALDAFFKRKMTLARFLRLAASSVLFYGGWLPFFTIEFEFSEPASYFR
jgi:hypothetical protein